LGVVLVWLPVTHRAHCLFGFMGSQVVGILLAAVLRRGSGRRRYVISVATSLGVLLGEVISKSLDPEHYTFGAVFIGFLAGIVLSRIVVTEGLEREPATVSRRQDPSSP